ncbi:MAG TPA: ribosome biogenesis GTPase Der [Candidatus Binatia bacterium]|nr:ribosome biogenesis GTPase Der [Candidatus Binatia bacterium]
MSGPGRSGPTGRRVEGLPVVAIVGRPNVGKSTLFNRIVGTRLAIVEDRARTTRDRLYATAEWNGRRFVVVDTGGLEIEPGDVIEAKVQEQARLAIAEADVIVFVVDAAAGPTPGDLEAAELLRRATAPVLVAANKADNLRRELEAAEFHGFGWTEVHPISALHGRSVADLLDAVVAALPPPTEAELAELEREARAAAAAWPATEDAAPGNAGPPESAGTAAEWTGAAAESAVAAGEPAAIAIVGRPNVGKSSLLNALLGEERAIVSEVPGTTRDAIDTRLRWGESEIVLIDTAGIRRRGRVASAAPAERYSALRALRAIDRADVAVLVVDATEGLTAQDAHIAGYVVEAGRGLVIALNKWDLVEKTPRTFDEAVAAIRRAAPFLELAPVVSISARDRLRVGRVLELALDVWGARRRRVSTGELNRLVATAVERQPPPLVHGRRPKIRYATQVAVAPPTFVFFGVDVADLHFSYRRYLENRLRDAYGFIGTPIRLVFRDRAERPARPEARRLARRR